MIKRKMIIDYQLNENQIKSDYYNQLKIITHNDLDSVKEYALQRIKEDLSSGESEEEAKQYLKTHLDEMIEINVENLAEKLTYDYLDSFELYAEANIQSYLELYAKGLSADVLVIQQISLINIDNTDLEIDLVYDSIDDIGLNPMIEKICYLAFQACFERSKLEENAYFDLKYLKGYKIDKSKVKDPLTEADLNQVKKIININILSTSKYN